MTEPAPQSQQQPGRLGRALLRMLMKQAQVVDVETVADGFRLITLESSEFKGVPWTPGQKMQIAMGSAFVARTFTPIEWDEIAGRTRILGYTHGNGPGSSWVDTVEPGAECDIFGPRSSLDAGRIDGPAVVFGDETSIGIACAIGRRARGNTQCLLEADSADNTRPVLAHLGLDRSELFERTASDAHLHVIESRLPALVATGATFVLTGKASSIQHLHRILKSLGVPRGRIMNKAYWAPGKTGLD